jgi:hypothetical protein
MNKCALIILSFLPLLNSTLVVGQKSKMSQSFIGDVTRHRGGPGNFSMKLRSANPIYKGYEISLAVPQSILKSTIPNLNDLKMTFLGANLGFVLASSRAKFKTTIGYYESDPSVPYTMTMVQWSLSGGIYPLRLLKARYHIIEPYTSAGLTYQHTWFYGTYLPNLDATNPNYNYSAAREPMLGKTGLTQFNLVLGFEYQLMSHKITFMHLFTEMNYGVPILWSASNIEFSGTKAGNMTMITAGINFGIIK